MILIRHKFVRVVSGQRKLIQNNGSHCVSGLYFAGELLDVDGICGGYNLQWAWSSGFVAGKCAAQSSIGEREKRI